MAVVGDSDIPEKGDCRLALVEELVALWRRRGDEREEVVGSSGILLLPCFGECLCTGGDGCCLEVVGGHIIDALGAAAKLQHTENIAKLWYMRDVSKDGLSQVDGLENDSISDIVSECINILPILATAIVAPYPYVCGHSC